MRIIAKLDGSDIACNIGVAIVGITAKAVRMKALTKCIGGRQGVNEAKDGR
jgi:hypothetical protein